MWHFTWTDNKKKEVTNKDESLVKQRNEKWCWKCSKWHLNWTSPGFVLVRLLHWNRTNRPICWFIYVAIYLPAMVHIKVTMRRYMYKHSLSSIDRQRGWWVQNLQGRLGGWRPSWCCSSSPRPPAGRIPFSWGTRGSVGNQSFSTEAFSWWGEARPHHGG